jgi:hypothetical protein
MDSRDHQQRNRLRHRLTDFAVWLHTRESFLHRSVRFQPAFLAEVRHAIRCFAEMVRVRKNRRKIVKESGGRDGLHGLGYAVNLSLRQVPSTSHKYSGSGSGRANSGYCLLEWLWSWQDGCVVSGTVQRSVFPSHGLEDGNLADGPTDPTTKR